MKYVAIDSETELDYERPEHSTTPPTVCWSIYPVIGLDEPLLLSAQVDSERVRNGLLALLADDNVSIVGQNIGFDLLVAWLHHDLPIEMILDKLNKGLIRDTSIREKLINIANFHYSHGERKTALSVLVDKYLGIDVSADKKGPDIWRLRYSELQGVPIDLYPPEAARYAKDDAKLTYDVFYAQKKGGYVSPDEDFQLRADIALKLMSRHTFCVDQAETALFKTRHTEIVKKVEPELVESGILKFNKHRYKDLYEKDDPRRQGYSVSKKVLQALIEADYIAQGLKIPLTKGGKSGSKQTATDSDSVRVCENPVLQKFASVQTSRKLCDTFVPNLEKAGNFQIRPYYDAIKKTGRTSCSRFPLHQMPRAGGARECLKGPRQAVDDRFVLVAADYTAFEMCSLAQVNYEKFGIATMKKAIDSGKDLHCVTAAQMMGRDLDEFIAAVDREEKTESNQRQGAKAYNFGAPGGMMETTFIKTLSDEDRQVIRDLFPGEKLGTIVKRQLYQWRDAWDMHSYFDEVSKKTFGGRTFSYKHPWSGRIRKGLGYSDGLNIQFQGRCADAAKNAMWMLTESCYRKGRLLKEMDVRVIAFIHDEFIFEGPKEGIKEWTDEAIRIMIDGASEVIPDVTIRAGAEVMPERWAKKGIKIEEYLK